MRSTSATAQSRPAQKYEGQGRRNSSQGEVRPPQGHGLAGIEEIASQEPTVKATDGCTQEEGTHSERRVLSRDMLISAQKPMGQGSQVQRALVPLSWGLSPPRATP